MIRRMLCTATIILTAVSGTAGTINNGTWSPSDCGAEPAPPVVEQSSVDAYNQSIKAINEWQQKANAYNTCLINEANKDNAHIAKTANDEQGRFHALIEKIKSDTDNAKAKLDRH
ncbi:MAG: hypothetical protein PHD43_19290 [Methylococcales bacterium]|nr:hypothetical protein [Methylococcales bacterium]